MRIPPPLFFGAPWPPWRRGEGAGNRGPKRGPPGDVAIIHDSPMPGSHDVAGHPAPINGGLYSPLIAAKDGSTPASFRHTIAGPSASWKWRKKWGPPSAIRAREDGRMARWRFAMIPPSGPIVIRRPSPRWISAHPQRAIFSGHSHG